MYGGYVYRKINRAKKLAGEDMVEERLKASAFVKSVMNEETGAGIVRQI